MGNFTAAVGRYLNGTPTTRAKVHVRTRVPIPAVVEPPVVLLRALREQDPNLDVFILPDGRVWLLQYQENRHRQSEGRKLLELAMKEGGAIDEMFMPRLMAAGFALLSEEDYKRGTSVGYMTRRAQQVLYATEQAVKEEMERRRRHADNREHADVRTKVLLDRIHSMARSDWKWAYRGRKSFSQTM